MNTTNKPSPMQIGVGLLHSGLAIGFAKTTLHDISRKLALFTGFGTEFVDPVEFLRINCMVYVLDPNIQFVSLLNKTGNSSLQAIISDIHGNLEALEAVLEDIKSQGIDKIYCLGDIIGYGPNPGDCIDHMMEKAQVTILGNHDQAALFDPEGFNAGAERAIFWARKQLESGSPTENERRWEFLGELPRVRREGDFMFVHGSARNPLNEYVFPEDVYNQRKMERIFGLVDKYCFQGHTHIPGIFTEDLNFLAPEEIDFRYELGEEKVLINVGSVGQPRNGDSRSSYVVLDGQVINFKRVEYDFEKTAAKIYPIPELDNFLGDRLKEGR